MLQPVLASGQGSIQGLVRISGSNGNIISLSAGAPTSTFTLTLPPSLPSSGSLLYGSGTGQLQWNPTLPTDAGYVLQLQDVAGVLTPKWIDPNTLFTTGSYVNYNTNSQQSTSVLRSNHLFNIGYGATADDAHAVGALITSFGGLTNRNATALTLTAAATGVGTATGLSVTAAGGAANNAIDATGHLRLLANGGSASRLVLQNPAGTFTSSFAAGAQTSNITYTLPTAAPAVDGYLLQANTAGVLSWTDPAVVANGTYWTLAGNPTTTAWNGTTGSFLGTTSTQPLVMGTQDSTDVRIVTDNTEHVRILANGNIGIGNTNPVMPLDITGAYGTRASTITLSDGTSNNVDIGNSSYVRIVGPSTGYTMTGLNNGFDGKRVRIANVSGKDWTIANESPLSDAANRIITNTNSNITISGPVPVLEMIYDAGMQRWLLGTLNANQVVGAVGSIVYVRKTQSETVTNNTTLQDDDHLVFNVNANETWELTCELEVSCPHNTPGMKIALEIPNNASMKVVYTGIQDAGGNSVMSNTTLTTSNVGKQIQIANDGPTLVFMRGIVFMGNTGGTIKVRWAQWSTSGSNGTTMAANSYMRIIRVQ